MNPTNPVPGAVVELPEWVSEHLAYFDSLCAANENLRNPENHSIAAALKLVASALASVQEALNKADEIAARYDEGFQAEGLYDAIDTYKSVRFPSSPDGVPLRSPDVNTDEGSEAP